MVERRLFAALFWLFFLLGVLAFRLVYIQLFSSVEYSLKAEQQFIRKDKIESNRGDILDRNGIVLATTIDSDSLFARPQELDKKQNLEILRNVCPDYKNKLKTKSKFVWLERKLDPSQTEAITRAQLAGIGITKEQKRYYPNGTLAAQVVGFVGMDNHGLAGIEQYFDKDLSGKIFNLKQIRDGKGRSTSSSLEPRQVASEIKKKIFTSIKLTIDRSLQHAAETEIEEGVKQFKASFGMVVLQNPKNGEILAMASYPNFDPNILIRGKLPATFNKEIIQNKPVQHIYEPGSTFKIVTFSAAMEEKKANPSEPIFCENGKWKYKSVTIKDHEAEGTLTFSEVMEKSSNIGTGKIALRLGQETLYKYIRAFGFGNRTGIALPSEPEGLLRLPQNWSEISLPILAFGQEIGVSAIQLIGAFSAIANGGLLMEPMIVKEIIESTPEETKNKIYDPQMVRRVVSTETAAALKNILCGVVERGTGVQAKIQGYTVAGKTGTAQKIDPATRKYSAKNYVSSFCGFLPAEDPQIVCLVVLDEPRTDYWGSSTATPIFYKIMSRAVSILGISPKHSFRLGNDKK